MHKWQTRLIKEVCKKEAQMSDYQEGNSGGLKQELWICTRQRAGPLAKECRALRPRLSANDNS